MLQLFLILSCPRRPHHQFSNCSCFSISYFRSLLFPKEKWTKNNENWTGKISESRNSCNVQVGGVGVEGMMSSKKIETLVWDWRKEQRVLLYALSVIPPDLEVPTPDNTHSSRNTYYHPLRHQGGPSYERPPVFNSQSEKWCLTFLCSRLNITCNVENSISVLVSVSLYLYLKWCVACLWSITFTECLLYATVSFQSFDAFLYWRKMQHHMSMIRFENSV